MRMSNGEKGSGEGCGGGLGSVDDMIPKLSLIEWEGGQVRANASASAFRQKFGSNPQFFVRVPGRVNLIGEHIDYCGYGVFPMAIEQDVFVSASVLPADATSSARLHVTNVLEKFSDFECSIDEIKEILANRKAGVAPSWYLYFLCGVQGIIENLSVTGNGVSFQVTVDGVIPPSAGLSSSSALVCAAALTTLVANNMTMRKEEMASICAKSERYIGTEGGGMDQAIAFLATAGTAQQIEFVPKLRGDKVRLPSKAVFVIANCLADANKAASASFNERVVECRLSTWILAKRSGLSDCFQFSRLKDLQTALNLSYAEMEALVHREIHEQPYQVDEISSILEVSTSELLSNPLMKILASKESCELKLFPRANHVIQEAQRVYKFREICETEAESASCLQKLGSLMNQSHWSLSQSYECSHPYLDQLVRLSEGTTYGARLTGAGWGGCMVALVDQQQLTAYMDTLLAQFYTPVHGLRAIDPRHVFVTQPGPGATILTSAGQEWD